MPEVTVKYKSEKSLQVLKDISKYFDFEVKTATPKKATKAKESVIVKGRGVTDETIRELTAVFTDAKMDAKKLRKSWRRDK
jgi:hypothetical protein